MKKFKAMVLSCIDPRFQYPVYNYLKKKKFIKNHFQKLKKKFPKLKVELNLISLDCKITKF